VARAQPRAPPGKASEAVLTSQASEAVLTSQGGRTAAGAPTPSRREAQRGNPRRPPPSRPTPRSGPTGAAAPPARRQSHTPGNPGVRLHPTPPNPRALSREHAHRRLLAHVPHLLKNKCWEGSPPLQARRCLRAIGAKERITLGALKNAPGAGAGPAKERAPAPWQTIDVRPA